MSSILKGFNSPMIQQGMQATLSVFKNGGGVNDGSRERDMQEINSIIEDYRDCMKRKAICDSTDKYAQSCVYKQKATDCKRKASKLIAKYREKYGRTESGDWMMYEGGGKINEQKQIVDKAKENLSESFVLPIEMAVYVPSTKGADETISQMEFMSRIKETEEYLSELFGGYSKVDIDGGYVSETKGLIKEDVAKVVAFSQDDDFLSNKLPRLIQRIVLWCKDWTQESIGFELEGDLFYVDKDFQYDKQRFFDGGQTQTFYNVIDDDGDFLLMGADENSLIQYANTIFYYDMKDSGESEIDNLEDAIDGFESLDYRVERVNPIYASGGTLSKYSENGEMVKSYNKQIAHHTKEMANAISKNEDVPAWVVAKMTRSATDLSDATHYLDGKGEFGDGGKVDYDMLSMDLKLIQQKYPNAKVSYFFAKDSSGKGYVITAKQNGKKIYSSYKMADGGEFGGGGSVGDVIEFESGYTDGSTLRHKGKILSKDGQYYIVKVIAGGLMNGKKTYVHESLVTKKFEGGGSVDKLLDVKHKIVNWRNQKYSKVGNKISPNLTNKGMNFSKKVDSFGESMGKSYLGAKGIKSDGGEFGGGGKLRDELSTLLKKRKSLTQMESEQQNFGSPKFSNQKEVARIQKEIDEINTKLGGIYLFDSQKELTQKSNQRKNSNSKGLKSYRITSEEGILAESWRTGRTGMKLGVRVFDYDKFVNSLIDPIQKSTFEKLKKEYWQKAWNTKMTIYPKKGEIKFEKLNKSVRYEDGGEFGFGGFIAGAVVGAGATYLLSDDGKTPNKQVAKVESKSKSYNLTAEQKDYLQLLYAIQKDGFNYAIVSYSDYKGIKNPQFVSARNQYKKSVKDLENYIEKVSPDDTAFALDKEGIEYGFLEKDGYNDWKDVKDAKFQILLAKARVSYEKLYTLITKKFGISDFSEDSIFDAIDKIDPNRIFKRGGMVGKKVKRIVRKGTKYGKLAVKKAKPKAKKIVRKLKIGFNALANKVAKSYEGKAVAPKYQKEYGKRYSKEEAKEVGNKVAAKVKRMKGM
jgi:ribosomal protein L39E